MGPKPVRISFPDGSEDLGILTNDNTLDVGVIGLNIHVDDVLIVDGTLVTVVGTTVRRSSKCGTDTGLVEEVSFRLRLGPYPPPGTRVA
jgi:hypothetical protein